MTQRSAHLLEELQRRGSGEVRDIRSLALAISRIPYGRPRDLSAEGVVASWRGTCSTKHLLFREVAPACDPQASVRLVHRVYRVPRDDAALRWGPAVAATVPAEGLVDVHTYAVLGRGEGELIADVTFPIADWDGVTPLRLACGEGEDHPAGDDPIASKAALTEACCDPVVRERFIATVSAALS